MTRVLVTGAAGFIGSHLVDTLLEQGDHVIGVDNFDPFYDRAIKERNLETALAHANFTLCDSDIIDVGALVSMLTPDTVMVHLAAKAGVRPSLADPNRLHSGKRHRHRRGGGSRPSGRGDPGRVWIVLIGVW